MTAGVLISQDANYNDWPLRSVHGVRKYVADPLERGLYPPVYVSDEDLFCIFKDTETQADPLYTALPVQALLLEWRFTRQSTPGGADPRRISCSFSTN